MMVRDISEFSRVKLARAELEREVAERTEQLSAENEKLMREIRDHNRAREALRETEERFRAIFENARDLIFTKDRSRRYTMVNPAMEKLHGRKAADIIGLRAEDFMEEEAAKRIKMVDLRVLAGETVEEEYVTPIKGQPTAFHGIRVPLKDAAGDIAGMCAVVRNITERKQAATAATVLARRNYPSEAMQATLRDASYAAPTDSIVLLLGESGCGKDYLARWIHDHSPRANGPFFAINCAAVAKELAESELFGHEPGAFTGARGAKRGLLQLAEGGTLLLNEIGELALSLQSKLLTFLDTKSFLRVGGERSVRVDARIIAATHRDLQREVVEGRFLSALYYRLNVFMIRVPPLRERREDLPLIADEIMSTLAAEMQRSDVPVLDAFAIDALSQYHWPGNVRELRNVLERALMLWDGGSLELGMPLQDWIGDGWTHKVRFPARRSLHDVADEFRRSICEEALRRTGGSKTKAARLLGISRGAFYRYTKGGGVSRDF
ncbi:MAG: sigma 54-interacting transcriptional regulator [Deltaproteobacteria bacterium]